MGAFGRLLERCKFPVGGEGPSQWECILQQCGHIPSVRLLPLRPATVLLPITCAYKPSETERAQFLSTILAV